MDKKNTQINTEVLNLIPKSIILRHRVFPMELQEKVLKVAVVDSFNVVAFDDIYLATGYEVEPVVVSEEDLDQLLDKYFGYSELDSNTIKEILEINEDDNSSLDINQNSISELEINDAPIIKVVNSLIHRAVMLKASDIHIEPLQDMVKVRFRKDGVLIDITNLPRAFTSLIASRIKIIGKMDIAEKRLPQDGRANITLNKKQVDLRISSLPTVHGEKVVIRILDKSTMFLGLDMLGMEERTLSIYKKLIKRPHGMILFTGPTGSGKTTSLYATLNYLKNPLQNIVTIEDPVEYVLPGINQTGVNNKIGLNFASGLRAILRQDPDIIMLGEIRDSETAGVAVQAAITGHLVFSTLHTNNASGAIARLIDMDIEPFLVSSAVIGVIAQRLVRKICDDCRLEYVVPIDSIERTILKKSPNESLILYKGRGCNRCNHTGYNGRVALFEILLITGDIHKLILNKASTGDIFVKAADEGMMTFSQDGISKALQGITTLEEVNRVVFGVIDGYS
ncbi:GspE/PulE family protein [Desulfitibacter alkalitolerans]|uniref:GspE/PulE family protein n=1 Tax=Desulfitibacter alkalitolerans TaxID=264641 RepID=UPI00068804EF|nr:GspE/PulE family protein [Desulfitibacter alkalitolerans]